MKTDTTEKGLESLIMRHLTGTDGLASGGAGAMSAEPAAPYGGSGWYAGSPAAYDRDYAVDGEQLFTFLLATQPDEYAKLGIGDYHDTHGMARQKFLARLQGEINRRGVIDVFRHGIKHGPLSFDLFYAPLHRKMCRQWPVMRLTGSALPGNCTSAVKTSAHSICAPSSTGCRWQPLS
jgi:type I restriction enzyme R subunit